MPNFLVVRCCNCNIFQVQQENKKRKFSCKICNYKQSVLRVYLESTNPSNCRAHVQECNAKIIPLLEEKKKLKSILNYGNYDERYQNSGNRTIDSYFKRDKTKETNKSYDDNINDYGKKNSHWNMYLSDSENDSENEEENEVKGKEKIDSLNEGKKLNELNNLDNEKEEELAKNLIEKIAESISKSNEDDTESSQEEISSDDEPENDTQNIIEINSNSALSKYYNNRMNDNSNTNTNKEIGRNPM
ncbi:hypothetical protein LY90DRAFT_104586 [Neocallimastix californiae]|uniref:MRN complex-interacting protein N-terminal domain-containing protein n=1 Tax=Neocallimastix californiae TaxID=1754190 RepID=A0A1Y2AVG9_9FUNG|nr:hypothetical protein LY90DRAFT_104586 [Neocallimastix californiae]|eukprot:ORY26217.1 hypothetical protein LY90DRAFT_104586 [Neocallimastix californiae]